eukprot:GHVP01006655.1.p2 GENE.GHVP01006655.1~~GHVP01006655.1.p2  ORF type:complete len:145 (-),score=25.67 GHVP01006655.1:928-1305(-)
MRVKCHRCGVPGHIKVACNQPKPGRFAMQVQEGAPPSRIQELEQQLAALTVALQREKTRRNRPSGDVEVVNESAFCCECVDESLGNYSCCFTEAEVLPISSALRSHVILGGAPMVAIVDTGAPMG